MTEGAQKLEQTTWDLFWVPPETEVVDRPELLVSRHPRREHLNTLLRVRGDDRSVSRLVAEASAFLSDRPSTALVVDTVPTRSYERSLSEQGYEPEHVHDARVVHVDEFQSKPRSSWDVQQIERMQQLRDCIAIQESAFSKSGGRTEAEYALELSQCTGPDTRVVRYVTYTKDGTPAACGGLTVFPDLRFGLLWAGCTHPDFRGQGAYSALVARRIADAKRVGLEHVGIYAREQSSSPIVAKQGFARVGKMVRWRRDGQAS